MNCEQMKGNGIWFAHFSLGKSPFEMAGVQNSEKTTAIRGIFSTKGREVCPICGNRS